jgi:hypothetical protein
MMETESIKCHNRYVDAILIISDYTKITTEQIFIIMNNNLHQNL